MDADSAVLGEEPVIALTSTVSPWLPGASTTFSFSKPMMCPAVSADQDDVAEEGPADFLATSAIASPSGTPFSVYAARRCR